MAVDPEIWYGVWVDAYTQACAGIPSASFRFLCYVLSHRFVRIRVQLKNQALALPVLLEDGRYINDRRLCKISAWHGMYFLS